jgi:hypothetical protein
VMAEFGETPDWVRPVCVMTLKDVTGVSEGLCDTRRKEMGRTVYFGLRNCAGVRLK